MTNPFQALVVDKTEPFSVEVRPVSLEELPAGEVLIKVAYSSVNYKDGLASIPNGNIVRNYPFIPGIDLSGTVVSSKDSRFREGQSVIATSYGIGVSHFGGFSEYARIPADWVVELPEGLTLREAMIYGTAGFTAALSVQALEAQGMTPDQGKVLVTGPPAVSEVRQPPFWRSSAIRSLPVPAERMKPDICRHWVLLR